MPAKPYEQFGPFILFKKLESAALGDLWRAGRIEGDHLEAVVALRRLSGGNREALIQSASEARNVVSLLSGTSFVKNQIIDVVDGIPVIAHEYGGGRSLRHIVDRAHGGAGISPNPIPIEQVIVIAEKIALSLVTTTELRYSGNRLWHGGLIPQFVWINNDGEIRVAGQHLGNGLVASLKEPKIAAEIGRYFAPECQSSGDPAKASDVYSMGALMYLLVTGNEPPDAVSGSAFTQTVRAAKSMSGQPIPEDIRGILEKSMAPDRAMRFASIGDLKQALSSLAHSGKYSATTFNLAFYLSNLLKKEIEGEAIEHEKESRLNLGPYLVQPVAASSFDSITRSQRRSRLPLYAAAGVALAAIGAGGVFMTIQTNASPPPVAFPPPAKPRVIPAPAPPPVVAATPAVDPAAEKKAFEAAVNQKLQEEMMKLQTQFNQKLQQQKPKNLPASEASASPATPTVQRSAPIADDRAMSAAALDERRLASRSEPPATTTIASPVPPQPQPQVVQQAPATTVPAPAETNAIHEGDVVDYTDLDTVPRPLGPPRPVYPPMALRQRIDSTVMVTALVSETGDVVDVKVLKGDPRFGFNEAAIRALRAAKFSAPMKNGKHVKTWFPQTINFRAGS
jgi:TonB family protein